MRELDLLLQNITGLTPLAVGLVTLAGLVVGIAPSSFPLISVAAGLAVSRGSADPGGWRGEGLWLAVGFALGIAQELNCFDTLRHSGRPFLTAGKSNRRHHLESS